MCPSWTKQYLCFCERCTLPRAVKVYLSSTGYHQCAGYYTVWLSAVVGGAEKMAGGVSALRDLPGFLHQDFFFWNLIGQSGAPAGEKAALKGQVQYPNTRYIDAKYRGYHHDSHCRSHECTSCYGTWGPWKRNRKIIQAWAIPAAVGTNAVVQRPQNPRVGYLKRFCLPSGTQLSFLEITYLPINSLRPLVEPITGCRYTYRSKASNITALILCTIYICFGTRAIVVPGTL